MADSVHQAPGRVDGYAPLREYAVIGDGRTAALVALDGSIDWLCLPDLDSPSVFGALVDAGTGGEFTLCPDSTFEAKRRYRPGTNVLETTFRTDGGAVRVIDAMTLPGKDLSPQREVVRAVEAVSGSVPMRWRLTPRFGFGMRSTRIGLRAGVPVATHGADAMAICSWDAGEPRIGEGSISGYFDVTAGGRALFALSVSHQEPLIIPSRTNVESRLATTGAEWRKWSDNLRYGTEWRDAVVRDALALKLLVHAPSGAIAAAATTSLPEEIGGARNWDYRFCWVRDSAFVLNALLRLGCVEEGREPIWANGIAAPFGEISTIVDPVPWVLAWSLKLLTSVSPCTKAPMVVGTTAIPYGFTSPLLGTVEPPGWVCRGWQETPPALHSGPVSWRSTRTTRPLLPDQGQRQRTSCLPAVDCVPSGASSGNQARTEPRIWMRPSLAKRSPKDEETSTANTR